jgi:hypothetical protein
MSLWSVSSVDASDCVSPLFASWLGAGQGGS